MPAVIITIGLILIAAVLGGLASTHAFDAVYAYRRHDRGVGDVLFSASGALALGGTAVGIIILLVGWVVPEFSRMGA